MYVCACIVDMPVLNLYKDSRETADLHALLHELTHGKITCYCIIKQCFIASAKPAISGSVKQQYVAISVARVAL